MHCAKENGVAGGMTIPMIHFRQGTRRFLEGVLPVTFITRQFDSKPAAKRASVGEAEKAINRPLLEDHVKAISAYLVDNATGTYILPECRSTSTLRSLSFLYHIE